MTAAVLGTIDAFAGLVMLWAGLQITDTANLRTAQGRWAFFRRVVYGCQAIGIFGLGVGRFDGHYPVADWSQAGFQAMLLFGVVIFPLLRAFNWISQDRFKTIDGSATERRRS